MTCAAARRYQQITSHGCAFDAHRVSRTDIVWALWIDLSPRLSVGHNKGEAAVRTGNDPLNLKLNLIDAFFRDARRLRTLCEQAREAWEIESERFAANFSGAFAIDGDDLALRFSLLQSADRGVVTGEARG